MKINIFFLLSEKCFWNSLCLDYLRRVCLKRKKSDSFCILKISTMCIDDGCDELLCCICAPLAALFCCT